MGSFAPSRSGWVRGCPLPAFSFVMRFLLYVTIVSVNLLLQGSLSLHVCTTHRSNYTEIGTEIVQKPAGFRINDVLQVVVGGKPGDLVQILHLTPLPVHQSVDLLAAFNHGRGANEFNTQRRRPNSGATFQKLPIPL